MTKHILNPVDEQPGPTQGQRRCGPFAAAADSRQWGRSVGQACCSVLRRQIPFRRPDYITVVLGWVELWKNEDFPEWSMAKAVRAWPKTARGADRRAGQQGRSDWLGQPFKREEVP